ncbi:MAG: PQQ-binding-like beta-propeller repeat protein [Candidatus Bathyarchaeota archaeon]|nr:PQQ-binding-like beta-propeller repeat protein [Candidatus Bathyarchaeota archaeon]
MKSAKNKTATMIALCLVLTFAVSLVALPAVNTVKAITWYPYLVAAPNPVGVGQRVEIVFGFTMPTASAANSYYGWTLTITDPDGHVQTATGLNTESTGSTFYIFTPDKVGTWKLKAHYPGGYVVFPDGNLSVPAADTNEFSLTVQEEQLSYPSETPLPTDYWTYPIYAENRGWSQIASNWLMPAYDNSRHFDSGGGAYNPYTKVPNTAHILWTKAQLFGGLVGGEIGDSSYYVGLAYRQELSPPVIINGRVYYNEQEEPCNYFYCVDLNTGETIWQHNASYTTATGVTVSGYAARITLGQVLDYNTPNGHGGMPFLWSTNNNNWAIRNAWTGDVIWTVANAPAINDVLSSYSFHIGEDGTLYSWQLDTTTGTLVLWNSTKMMASQWWYGFLSAQFFSHGTGGVMDWNSGIEWNATVNVGPGYKVWAWDPKDASVIILSNQTRGLVNSVGAFEDVAVSGKDGHVLWRKIRDEGTWESLEGGQWMSIADDRYYYLRKETRQVYAYSVSTGEKKWVSDPRPNQWGMYMMGGLCAYGKFYVPAYDGMVIAYDAATGDTAWTFGPVSAGLETPYGVYPFYGGLVAADGKIIAYNGEHSADSPLYRGERMYVLNATTGEEIWSISGWDQTPCAANGIILTPNGYDGKIYCFGKGPSKTTVQAPLTQVTMGETVTITGTVTDESPGAAGTPAVADECMSQWMEYLYMQKPMPTNATGVTVYIDVLDANNNYRNIGTATSDVNGFYSFVWKPDIPGKFTVIARFAGSESYGSSYAEAAFNVVDAPAATPEPTPTPASMADLYFMPMSIGMIVAIIVVGALIILMLRKRP